MQEDILAFMQDLEAADENPVRALRKDLVNGVMFRASVQFIDSAWVNRTMPDAMRQEWETLLRQEYQKRLLCLASGLDWPEVILSDDTAHGGSEVDWRRFCCDESIERLDGAFVELALLRAELTCMEAL